MKVVLTGASGFIGKHLITALLEQGYSVTAVSRNVAQARDRLPSRVRVIGWENSELKAAMESSDIVINLAGESIASGTWSHKRKKAIINSRLLAAQRLYLALETIKVKPKVFLQASAIGIYGNRNTEECSELCRPGEGFLAEVCSKWESYIPQMEHLVDRLVTIRIGVVLGKEGGIIPELLKQSKKHLAGVLGTGDQWISWIHIYDLVYAILYLMNDEKAKGYFNLTAPQAVQQKEFAHLFKRITGNKIQLPAPAFMIRMLLGEFGKELLLGGQKVSSAKLTRQGFPFKYIHASDALQDILRPYPSGA